MPSGPESAGSEREEKMGFSIGGKEKVKSEPNVVPLCDVLLVLLIIFMVVTPLVQKGVDVKLPTALNTINMPDNPEVVLAIRRDGSMYVNQDQATMDNLQTLLEDAFLTASEKKLYLKADQELEYGKIVDIIQVVKDAGIEIMGIITEVKTEKGQS
jgi:biopolymer transport protein ExbD